ncbi:MAG: type I 3-dehydroquinate dehydratase [Luteolibacter sp.]
MASGSPLVVGSFGSRSDLLATTADAASGQCDVVEIRLDLMEDALQPEQPAPWRHLRGLPLLFTARRGDEGGHGALDAPTRVRLLERTLDDAACIDLEVASIPEAGGLIEKAHATKLPWIASFHDFGKLPESSVLESKAELAREAGAAVFKLAARLHSPGDLARLAEFQAADHGIPVATMGMGRLAPVSRLLCAQCGSVLNYGYLGSEPTAPGQWSAAMLRQAIAHLAPLP